jgi:hypothetical protein
MDSISRTAAGLAVLYTPATSNSSHDIHIAPWCSPRRSENSLPSNRFHLCASRSATLQIMTVFGLQPIRAHSLDLARPPAQPNGGRKAFHSQGMIPRTALPDCLYAASHPSMHPHYD